MRAGVEVLRQGFPRHPGGFAASVALPRHPGRFRPVAPPRAGSRALSCQDQTEPGHPCRSAETSPDDGVFRWAGLPHRGPATCHIRAISTPDRAGIRPLRPISADSVRFPAPKARPGVPDPFQTWHIGTISARVTATTRPASPRQPPRSGTGRAVRRPAKGRTGPGRGRRSQSRERSRPPPRAPRVPPARSQGRAGSAPPPRCALHPRSVDTDSGRPESGFRFRSSARQPRGAFTPSPTRTARPRPRPGIAHSDGGDPFRTSTRSRRASRVHWEAYGERRASPIGRYRSGTPGSRPAIRPRSPRPGRVHIAHVRRQDAVVGVCREPRTRLAHSYRPMRP